MYQFWNYRLPGNLQCLYYPVSVVTSPRARQNFFSGAPFLIFLLFLSFSFWCLIVGNPLLPTAIKFKDVDWMAWTLWWLWGKIWGLGVPEVFRLERNSQKLRKFFVWSTIIVGGSRRHRSLLRGATNDGRDVVSGRGEANATRAEKKTDEETWV